MLTGQSTHAHVVDVHFQVDACCSRGMGLREVCLRYVGVLGMACASICCQQRFVRGGTKWTGAESGGLSGMLTL